VLRCRYITKQTSGNIHPIDGQKRTQKTHCSYKHEPLLVHLPYNTVSYIVVFSTMSSTFCILRSLSTHASLQWYRGCHERRRHGRRPSQQKKSF